MNLSSPSFRRDKRMLVCAAGSLMVAAIGAAVILGWYCGWTRVVQIHHTLVPMQYNTAFGFLLIGLATLALLMDRRRWAVAGASVCGLIGLLTLSEYLFGISLGIDELFMQHYITVETSHPGRMAPNTALCFLVTAFAVVMGVRSRKETSTTAIAAAIALSLGLVAFVGYLGTISTAYGWGQLTRMALHTSIAFILVSVSLLGWAWMREGRRLPSWLAQLAGIAGATTTVLIWQSVVASLGNRASSEPATYGNLATTLMLLFGLAATTLLAFALRAVHRLREAIERLEKSSTALELSSKNVEDVAYVASHDLKAPLRAIDNLSQWIVEDASDALPEKSREHLDLIRHRIGRMEQLIEDLLTFSRAGRVHGAKKQVDCRELVEGTVSFLDVPIGMRVVISGSFPEITTFPTPLETCLRNLIANAIKHHHDPSRGTVEITCSEDSEFVEFAIADDGPGIADNFHEKIFILFQRLQQPEEQKGSGMGLAFVKKSVTSYGGHVSVESDGKSGTTFRLLWPKYVATDLSDPAVPVI